MLVPLYLFILYLSFNLPHKYFYSSATTDEDYELDNFFYVDHIFFLYYD